MLRTEELKAAAPLLEEYAELEQALADPSLHSDQNRARKVGRRYAELGRVVKLVKEVERLDDDLEAGRELAEMDPEFAEEVEELEAQHAEVVKELVTVLAPRDPDDAMDVILEVKAGEGGEESALFAADLARMYMRYADNKNWKAETLSTTHTGLGGYKEITIAIRAKGNPTPDEGVWNHLKYEGGVHRVQRVPVTESQGRIHTSAAGVMVMPEVEEDDEIELDMNELRIDVYRSSGPGGQSVNTTDSAVRITHEPTGIVVSMQDEKSQLQNRQAALRVLKARLIAEAKAAREAEESELRLSQVRTMDRSERIRTYNFPENRITDHRTGFKAYDLDQVLEGELEAVVRSAIEADEVARLQSVSKS